jgi:hypothetical protein
MWMTEFSKKFTRYQFRKTILWPFLPTHCRCRGLLQHLITFNDTQTDIHTHTHISTHSVGLPSAKDRPVAETYDNTQHLQTDKHPCPGGIRTRNPSKRAAAYIYLNCAASGIAITNFKKYKLSTVHLKSNRNTQANLNFNILKLIKLFDIDTKFCSRATGSPVPSNVVVY